MSPCPACGGATATIWREGPYRAHRCTDCGHVHSAGDSDPAVRPAVYEDDYFERFYLAHRASRIAYFEGLVVEHGLPVEEPLLDIGAGVGFWLAVCRERGVGEATAVEPSAFGRRHLGELAASAMPGLEVVENLAALADRSARYRTITLLDVLSHVDDLRGTLAAAHRLLAEGGRLILKAPNHPPALFRAAQGLAPLARGRALLCVRSQQHHFSARTLPEVLGRAGFRQESLRRISEAPPALRENPRAWALHRLTRAVAGRESLLWVGGAESGPERVPKGIPRASGGLE